MKKMIAVISLLLLVLGLISGCGSSTQTAANGDSFKPNPSQIIMDSGPIGGGWYSSAAAIAEILMKEIPGLNVTVTEGGGITNIKEVSAGKAQIGYTFSDAFNDAVNGKGEFQGSPVKNISGLATLYQSLFQTVVLDNSKYKTYADLKNGAKILPGKKTFTGQIFTETLLKNYYGTTYDDIEKNGGKVSYTGFSEMTDLLKDGHADAAMAMTDAPSSFIMELNATKKVRFLEIEPEVAQKIAEVNPGFAPAQIPANTYEGITQPANTVGTYTIMFLSNDIPDELAKRIVKAIVEHKSELAQNQKSLSFISKETLKEGFKKVPMHPGVESYISGK